MWWNNTKKKEETTSKEEDRKKKYPFSKVFLIQESVLVWIVTLCCLAFAFICIFKDSYIELPWISVLCALPWTAYGITANAYYKKSTMENTKGGIIFENTLGGLTFGAKQTDSDEPVG